MTIDDVAETFKKLENCVGTKRAVDYHARFFELFYAKHGMMTDALMQGKTMHEYAIHELQSWKRYARKAIYSEIGVQIQ